MLNFKKYKWNSKNSNNPDLAYNADDPLVKARKNIESWFGWFSRSIERADMCTQFLFEEQWDTDEIADYNVLSKPRLTYNKLHTFVRQVVAEQRQNTPNLQLRATDENVDQKKIDVMEGLVREIAYHSRNDIVYQTAFENALIRGFGALRLYIDYEAPGSFNRVIKLAPITDSRYTFFDPMAKEPTKWDGNFCGTYTYMAKDEFDRKYPDVKYPSEFLNMNIAVGPGVYSGFQWDSENTITVLEYFEKEWSTKTFYQMEGTGASVSEDDLDEYYKNLKAQGVPKPRIVGEKKDQIYKIMHKKMIANQVLEETEWPGQYFPIIFVDGDSFHIYNEQFCIPYIYFAMDPQRFENYLISEIAYMLKTNHRGRYVADPNAIAGYEQEWRNPENASILRGNIDKIRYDAPAGIPPSIMQLFGTSNAAYEQILGRYGATQGQDGNEISGVALNSKIKQGNISPFTYVDNLNRAIEQVGRVVMDVLPVIYDTTRSVNLIMKDKGQRTVTINKSDAWTGETENEIGKGKFDIMVQAGSSFAAQKSEAINQMMQLVQVNPQIGALVIDLIAENLDLENMPQIVERIRNSGIVPPDVLAKEQGKPPPQQQPDPQAMMEQQKMQTEQMKAQADQEKAQAQMIDAKRRVAESHVQGQVANIKAHAEVEKAALDSMGRHAELRKSGLEEENQKMRGLMGIQ